VRRLPISKPFPYTTLFRSIGLEGIEAFCTANAIKYLWRWKRKNGTEDLQKAIWYINRIIDRAGEPPEERKGLFNMTENKHGFARSEEHTSELQSRFDLVCR